MQNNDNIITLRGISEKRAALYKKLGIETVRDLVYHFPRGYIDYTNPSKIKDAEFGEVCVVKAEVIRKLSPYYTGFSGYSRLGIYKAVLHDGVHEFLCVFFNSEYNFNKLVVGKEYVFHGKVGGNDFLRELNSPTFIEESEQNKLIPKYPLTAGLTQNMLANNLKLILPDFNEPETLPDEILREFTLSGRKQALESIHFPTCHNKLEAAKRRLAFEELLILQLGMTSLKKRNRKLTGAIMHEKSGDMKSFYKALPFEPTDAQKCAVEDCIKDMQKKVPMNRLLQGDVGSGKTMVAAALCCFAYKNDYQAVFMAPTEILAGQHYGTLKSFLKPLGINVELLTGSLSASEKKSVKQRIKEGTAHVIIGTQALIQKGVEFHRLGLVVTDEQHRFGVNQRGELISKGENPHTLVMSATPIPRTLALIIYGDLDISLLDEMPKGRIPIITYAVDASFRKRLYNFILKNAAEGSQAYIVCPLIGDDDTVNEKAAAVKYYNELKSGFLNDLNVGLLHGRMKQAEKDAVMEGFKNGEISVLVSTTVIEVGIDVPNSTIMLIENAERFGLSQLHQLRGRVGRGEKQSYCILVTDNQSAYTKARLETMVRTANGFEVANEDLKLRGPGDFFGSKQHGLPEFKVADMMSDVRLVDETKALASRLLDNAEELHKPQYAELRGKIQRLFSGLNEHGFN